MEAWPEGFTLLADLSETRWVELEPWVGRGTKVISVVPAGYPTYVHVLHPAGSVSGLHRWSAVARATGHTMHPLVQWESIAEVSWHPPDVGQSPSEVLSPLVSTLRVCTATPNGCFFAIWDGWAQLHSPSHALLRSSSHASLRFSSRASLRSRLKRRRAETPSERFIREREEFTRSHPRFEVDSGTGRPYLLGTGPLEVGLELNDYAVYTNSDRLGVPVSMWWPTDHAWFVASEIDFDSTLVGGSAELREALVSNSELEALEVPPDGVLSA